MLDETGTIRTPKATRRLISDSRPRGQACERVEGPGPEDVDRHGVGERAADEGRLADQPVEELEQHADIDGLDQEGENDQRQGDAGRGSGRLRQEAGQGEPGGKRGDDQRRPGRDHGKGATETFSRVRWQKQDGSEGSK